ncbi:MAG: extracellular solute-binding protein [Clostridia bacterium]|nr:extracellular solute-binding protein [Clostridia bacterium]
MKNLSLRILASLMALLLLMGLAACGGNGGNESSAAPVESSQSEASAPESSAPEADASATTTADSGKTTASKPTRTLSGNKKAATWAEIKAQIPAGSSGKELRVYDWNPQSEVPGMDKVNKKFTEETGIKINYTIVTYGSYFTKIAAEVSSKNAPDAVRIQNVDRKNLANLQPMQNLGFDFSDAAWDKNVVDAYTFNGNIYGVNMIDSPYYCPALVYYNKNLIESSKLDDPYDLWKKGKWTWDKLWEMCEDFIDEADGDDFIGLSTMAFMEYQQAYNKPAITYDKKTNTFKHNLEDANFIKSWKIYANNYEKGLISQALTNNDAFDGGKLLFNVSMGIAARDGSSYFRQLRSQGAVACVPLPALKAGTKDYQVLGEVQAFGIPKTAKNPALVPYYLRYYFDVDNYNMKKFYNVDHAAEVIEYVQKKNPAIQYNGAIMTAETTGFTNAQFIDKLKKDGAANVQMTLASYVPTVNAAMAEAQNFFASL